MRQLIRWGRQVLTLVVSSAAAVGPAPRGMYGRPPAGTPSSAAASSLASAVRVLEDGGESMSMADWTDIAECRQSQIVLQSIKVAKLLVESDRFVEPRALQNLSLF